ncbi:hypothetical protein [Paraglaciecola psychrophila]|uniref:Uncharacterized protein n=1 Tax=Paraglaciecola psychrophila 170 TaxID=1129794 RepID=K7ACD1_9ALTE|nr:hypothetical protein [Paraglaciecola psychrophila]AGH46891.1 hypothetical protein C427_4792 [Paraglaciecola psychrophila 170]GAC39927.1 hypothetical protein GPSY_4324 [Paraglaciecola psychrophila 170]
MTFANPLALFLHLFAIDEENMLKNLPGFIEQKHGFYADVLALIAAHVENKNQTSFGTLIGQQAELLVEDNIIHNLAGKQAGLYKLIKKLGQGGMGAVYLGLPYPIAKRCVQVLWYITIISTLRLINAQVSSKNLIVT